MTDREQWALVNKNLRRFVDNKREKRNVVYLNSGNSLAHEMTKARLCYFLRENDRVFLTECRMPGRGRPDVLVLDCDPPLAYEIVESEAKESIELKREEWSPVRVKVLSASTGFD